MPDKTHEIDRSRAPAKRKKGKGLSSITNAIHLLKTFDAEEFEIGISDLAKRLGLAKSTVYRIASTLAAEGLLEQNPVNDKYRLGIALFGFATLVRQRMDVSTVGRPLLIDLRARVNETVLLWIPNGDEVMCINHFESSQAVRIRTDIGVRKPMASTAEGLAYLATQPAEDVDSLLARLPGPKRSLASSRRRLRQRIAAAAEQGYVIDNEDSEAGMCCVAAPLYNAEGGAIACLSVALPTQRGTAKAIADIIADVASTALEISTRLGYRR